MLKKASKPRGQAKELDKALKEKDSYGNEINQGKMDRVIKTLERT